MSAQGPRDAQAFARVSKEYADLTPIVEAIGALGKVRRELAEAEALLDDPTEDAGLKALAEEEAEALRARVPDLERKSGVEGTRVYGSVDCGGGGIITNKKNRKEK